MRRPSVVFALSTMMPAVALIAFAFACGVDAIGGEAGDDDGGASPNPSGSASSSADGNITPPPPNDANGSDAPIDAPIPIPITITVTSKSGPRADVRVVFHDAAGSVLETKLTGADGKATSSDTLGVIPSMASALLSTGNERNVVTWTGVGNGDQLELRDVEPDDSIGSYGVKPPANGFVDAGATSYMAFTGACKGVVDGVGTIPLVRSCVSGTQASVLVSALDDNSSTTLGYSFLKGNPVPADGGTINVTTNAWEAPSMLDVTLINAPVDVTVFANLMEISDGVGFAISEDVVVSTNTISFKTAKGFADTHQASVWALSGNGAKQMLTKSSVSTTALAFNGNDMPPAITSSSLNKTNSRRPILSWIAAASTATTDGGLALINFKGPGSANFHWTFVVAPGSTSVTAPAMPPEADMFLPPVDAGPQTFFSVPEIAFIEADTIASYAAFRQQHVATTIGLRPSFSSFTLPVLPANASFKVSSFVESL